MRFPSNDLITREKRQKIENLELMTRATGSDLCNPVRTRTNGDIIKNVLVCSIAKGCK